jgi:hypothetical protein
MTSGRDDDRSSGIWAGALTILVGVAAVIVTALALNAAEQRFAAVAIGIAGAVIFGSALIIAVVRKSIIKRRTIRQLNEERALIIETRDALEKVKRDLGASSERSDSFDDDIQAVDDLIARIKATARRDSPAASVAKYMDEHPLRPEEPEVSLRTVIDAKGRCARALAVHAHLEPERGTTGRWLKHRGRHPELSPENTAVSRSKFRILTGTGLRIPHGEHKAIADATGSYSRGSTVPKAIPSPKPEGESEMSGVATLPIAVGYQEKLALLKSQLSKLEEMPVLPHYITGDAIYQWRGHVLDWTVEARRTLTNAVDLASVHERGTYRSGRLDQASEDAEIGLRAIRGLVGQLGESADISEFRRQREAVIAAIADIVAYAAGM